MTPPSPHHPRTRTLTAAFDPPDRPRRSTGPAAAAAVALAAAVFALVGLFVLLPRPRPVEAPYVTDAALADPCALRDAADLAEFGRSTPETGETFNVCSLELTVSDGSTVKVDFGLYGPVGESITGPRQRTGRLVIIRGRRNNDNSCDRNIVLPEHNVIDVRVTPTGKPLHNSCAIADVGTNNVLRVIASGTVPDRPAGDPPGPPSSLVNADACALLTPTDLAGVLPGLDPSRRYALFANWTCSWGANSGSFGFGPPAVQVEFSRVPALTGPLETIGGRPASVQSKHDEIGGDYCQARVQHRRTSWPGLAPFVETADVDVYARLPGERRCQLARTLAARIVPRLPHP